MAKSKEKQKTESQIVDNFYKGYDLSFLKENPDHPDYHLVAEAASLEAGEESEE